VKVSSTTYTFHHRKNTGLSLSLALSFSVLKTSRRGKERKNRRGKATFTRKNGKKTEEKKPTKTPQ
jgi:hypothetical protein